MRRSRLPTCFAIATLNLPALLIPAHANDDVTPATGPAGGTSDDTSDSQSVNLERVVVTGSRLRQSEKETSEPVKIITREDIDAIGAGSVSDVLNTVSDVAIQNTTSAFQNSRGMSTVQLHGLPQGTTLVLVNGRRIGESGLTGGQQFNLSLLPLAAVDHIEVLPSGSSAVYGADALAGVVNVVLKKDFEGFVADARYGNADDYNDTQSDIGWGFHSSRASFMVLGEFSGNNQLSASQRSLTSNFNYTRFPGGVDARSTYSNPGNVYSVDGSNLPGLNSSQAAIPYTANGQPTIADFAATQGVLNKTSQFEASAPLIPRAQQYGGVLQGSYELTQSIGAFVEVLYSHNHAAETDYPPLLSHYDTIVPASNPFNPFGVPVGVDYLIKGVGISCYCSSNDFLRPVLGVRGVLGSWDWEVSAGLSRNLTFEDDTGFVDPDKVTAALADTNPATALNPFVSGAYPNPSQIASLYGTTEYNLNDTLRTYSGLIRGPAVKLPAGNVEVAVGAELQREALDYQFYGSQFTGRRTTDAGYAEVKVPLIGPVSSTSGSMLAISGAVRVDRYSDFGTRTSPQGGIEFRPIESLLLRASASSAFKPPTLYDLYAPQSSFPNEPVTDPQRGGQQYLATLVQGGNPNLKPLTGSSISYGLVFSPESIKDLEVHLTNWIIRTNNYPTILSYQALLDNPIFSANVIRSPPTAQDLAQGYAGVISKVLDTEVAFGQLNASGIDYDISWKARTPIGVFSPTFSLTQTYKYESALTPGSPLTSDLSQAVYGDWAPRLKGTTGLGWKWQAVQASFTGRYVGSYRDYDYATSGRIIGNFWTFDAYARYDIGENLAPQSRFFRKAYVAFGGVNIFNRLPNYSNFLGSIGYDPTQYDIRGRYLYSQVGIQF